LGRERWAKIVVPEETRSVLLDMAREWQRLADQQEGATDLRNQE
jgi:hypothetical protein